MATIIKYTFNVYNYLFSQTYYMYVIMATDGNIQNNN